MTMPWPAFDACVWCKHYWSPIVLRVQWFNACPSLDHTHLVLHNIIFSNTTRAWEQSKKMTRAKSSKKGFEFRYTPYHLRDCFGVRTSVLASTTSRVLQQEVLDPPSSIFVTKCHQHSGENCATNILELAIIRANITTRRKPLLNTNVDLYRRGKKEEKKLQTKIYHPRVSHLHCPIQPPTGLVRLVPVSAGRVWTSPWSCLGVPHCSDYSAGTLCKAIRAV
jgi:hypothetical protein